MTHLHTVGFPEAKMLVGRLVGYEPRQPVWKKQARQYDPEIAVAERWRTRRKPWPGSRTWRYLRDERHLPEALIRAAVRDDLLREGPRGSMWAAHKNGEGTVTGWEERGPEWRGYSTGGAKVLFRFGHGGVVRLCVTEAAIDALSLAALETGRHDSLYVSTGGGWAPATEAAIGMIAARHKGLLVAATDNNAQGDVYADRLRGIASEMGCDFERLRPDLEDWNEELRARRRGNLKSGPSS